MPDRRLARHARAVRPWAAACVVLGTLSAAAVIGQAWALAALIVAGFQRGAAPGAETVPLAALAVCVAARALIAWATEAAAFHAAASVKSALRVRLAAHALALGPQWLAGRKTAALVTLATRGVDALDGYFARYVPQVVLSVTVPAAVLAVLFGVDWESGLIVLVTLPLIPLFLALVGLATRAHTERQRRALDVLAGHFLDVVAGLPDLLVFGRAKAQAAAIRRATEANRTATLRTLRLAFLSSLVLELASTVSVAMVAVGIGLRLVAGTLDLHTGLLVLILAPEAYWPLRQVGAFYHASAEGKAAADEVLAVLEAVPAMPGQRSAVAGIDIKGLTIRYPGRSEPALADFSLTVAPGECVALVGASGAGKSTVLKAVLGFVTAEAGTAAAGGPVAWLPQHPHLFAGTVGENVRLARPQAGEAEVWAALRAAGAADFVAALPGGLSARIGERGHGLSAGQRQRLALARVFLADRPVVLLDEPTAALDAAGEAEVVASVRRLVAGRTAIVVAHRTALAEVADRVVVVGDRCAAPVGDPANDPGRDLPRGRVVTADGSLEEDGGVGDSGAPSAPIARLALAAALGTAASGAAVGLAATAAWLISRASQEPPILVLMVAITGVRALGIGRAVFRYAERLVTHDAAFRVLAGLRVRTYERLRRQAPGRRRGDLLSRFVADVDAVQERYVRFLIPSISAGLVGGGAALAIAAASPGAAIVTAAGLAVTGVVIPLVAAGVSRRADAEVAPVKGVLSAEFHELLRGAPDLIAADAVHSRVKRLQAADRRLTDVERRSVAGRALGAALTALATGATVWGVIFVGLRAVHAGRMDGLLLAVVVLTPLALFETTAGMPQALQYLRRARAAERRVQEVLDAPDAVTEPAAPRPLPAQPALTVDVTGLEVTWPGGETPALHPVDLKLTPGRKVAVVGPSGSGKTTLISALLRFVEPTAGRITLGGVPTAELAADDVRRVIGLCAQDAHIFDSTLRENLRLARPDATDRALEAALTRARLADWVRTLPDGLDTFVGEHGARLSGGQHRRLVLARALLAGFPVLLLDEPTEHLDPATADTLLRDLLALPQSVLLVTHRLTGLEGVDEIVVLDGGRVVERGTWGELMRLQGVFHSMCSVYA
ncbi:thiol reductant ABC exporter subunit CydD [Catenulispora subtropica]|uniref:Thiol reductant ABC exporter subunit CydD n=1 Tax=Catenulispora subtropica TaxID=450798 RepID=A0ABN2RK32_9ACTN